MIGIINIIAFLFLAFCTLCDLRSMQIPLAGLVIFGLVIVGIGIINGTLFQQLGFLQLIPGAVFLLISLLGKQSVGYGDGMVILLLGILLGISRCVAVIFMGLIFCSIVSIFILLLKKGNRRTKLPFMPFLLAAWGVSLFGR